jgi:purine-binding chemotaxis protein CheW
MLSPPPCAAWGRCAGVVTIVADGQRDGGRPVVLQRDQAVLLVFEIERHRYGIHAGSVHEIVRAVQPSRLPRAPLVVAGVINLRGEIVALIDLRLRFALPPRGLQADEVFLIVAARGRRWALRADAARELTRVPESSIVPAASALPGAELIGGTAVLDDGLLVICDLEAFLDDAELVALDDANVALAEATP